MKILAFEEGGYCVWSKRLEQGQFAALGAAGTRKRVLCHTELLALLEGVDVVIKRQRKRYKAAVGQKETSFFRLPSGEMFEKPDIQWRGWWPSTVAQQAL
jgi:hypothetical protein